MRGMFLCVIMVLVPLASAFSSPSIIDEDYGVEIWYESVVYSKGEVVSIYCSKWICTSVNNFFPQN